MKAQHGIVNMRFLVMERLRALRARPQMQAFTREAYVVQVVLLFDLLGALPELLREKEQKEFKVPGTCGADRDKLIAPVDDEWARAFLDDVLESTGLWPEFHWQDDGAKK